MQEPQAHLLLVIIQRVFLCVQSPEFCQLLPAARELQLLIVEHQGVEATLYCCCERIL
jgi:hypothetical protein